MCKKYIKRKKIFKKWFLFNRYEYLWWIQVIKYKTISLENNFLLINRENKTNLKKTINLVIYKLICIVLVVFKENFTHYSTRIFILFSLVNMDLSTKHKMDYTTYLVLMFASGKSFKLKFYFLFS